MLLLLYTFSGYLGAPGTVDCDVAEECWPLTCTSFTPLSGSEVSSELLRIADKLERRLFQEEDMTRFQKLGRRRVQRQIMPTFISRVLP